MAVDPFGRMNPGPNGPYVYGEAVTPSDTTLFDTPMRGLWIGGTGTLRVTLRDQPAGVALNLTAVPAGVFLPLWVNRGAAVTQLIRTNGSISNGVWAYGTCPYTGTSMFKRDNTTTTDPNEDVCDHHLTGCTARFGVKTAKPIEAFPGIALVRA